MNSVERRDPPVSRIPPFLFILPVLAALSCIPAAAQPSEEQRVLSTYIGPALVRHERSSLDLEILDPAVLAGAYLRWTRPERYRWDFFLSRTQEVGYGRLWTAEFRVDWFVDRAERAWTAVGLGIEVQSLETDHDDRIEPYLDHETEQNLYLPYVRVGREFALGTGRQQFSILPWVGFRLGLTRGRTVLTPGELPEQPPVRDTLVENEAFGFVGIAANATLHRILIVDAELAAAFALEAFHSRLLVTGGVYPRGDWGVSYRFSFGWTSLGSIAYHAVGVSYRF